MRQHIVALTLYRPRRNRWADSIEFLTESSMSDRDTTHKKKSEYPIFSGLSEFWPPLSRQECPDRPLWRNKKPHFQGSSRLAGQKICPDSLLQLSLVQIFVPTDGSCLHAIFVPRDLCRLLCLLCPVRWVCVTSVWQDEKPPPDVEVFTIDWTTFQSTAPRKDLQLEKSERSLAGHQSGRCPEY